MKLCHVDELKISSGGSYPVKASQLNLPAQVFEGGHSLRIVSQNPKSFVGESLAVSVAAKPSRMYSYLGKNGAFRG